MAEHLSARYGSDPEPDMTDPVLAAIRSRRVVRALTSEPVARHTIEAILDAGRWASTAGNRHLQRFVATDHPGTLRVLRMVSPGMIQRPTAAITICTDQAAAADYWVSAERCRALHRRRYGGGHHDARRTCPRDRRRPCQLVQPRRCQRRPPPAHGLESRADHLPRPPGVHATISDEPPSLPPLARPHDVGPHRLTDGAVTAPGRASRIPTISGCAHADADLVAMPLLPQNAGTVALICAGTSARSSSASPQFGARHSHGPGRAPCEAGCRTPIRWR